MKLRHQFLAIALLLGLGLVSHAETPAAAADEVVPSIEALEAEIFMAEDDCERQETPTALPTQPGPAEVSSGYCGSCSTGGCYGAARGQYCNSGNGFGNCNIYSGGYLCPDGDWECYCATGPLP